MLLLSTLLGTLLLCGVVHTAPPIPGKATSRIIGAPFPSDVHNTTLAIAEAKRLGTRLPPGYPDHPYTYHVPHSDITLSCNWFYAEPRQNTTKINLLLNRMLHTFSDPRQQDTSVYSGRSQWHRIARDEAEEWHEPAGNIDKERISFASVLVRVPVWDRLALTYGDVTHALRGMRQIFISWPGLDFDCMVVEGEMYLGMLQLLYTAGEEEAGGRRETA